jgi:hypothetical protein
MAGGGKQGIGQGRSNRWNSGLTDAARFFATRPNVHLDLGHLLKPQDGIVAEARLHDSALLDRDFTFERRRKAEGDAAFHLRCDQVWIYGKAAVDGADDAMNPDRARLTDGNLRNLSDVAAEGVVDRKSSVSALGRGRSPARLFGRKIEDAAMTRGSGQELAAEGKRIRPGSVRKLVDEAFDGECIL